MTSSPAVRYLGDSVPSLLQGPLRYNGWSHCSSVHGGVGTFSEVLQELRVETYSEGLLCFLSSMDTVDGPGIDNGHFKEEEEDFPVPDLTGKLSDSNWTSDHQSCNLLLPTAYVCPLQWYGLMTAW